MNLRRNAEALIFYRANPELAKVSFFFFFYVLLPNFFNLSFQRLIHFSEKYFSVNISPGNVSIKKAFGVTFQIDNNGY